MASKPIRITESTLHRIVMEAVNNILNEVGDTDGGQRKLGALQARKVLNADGKTSDEVFDNQAREGGRVYDYAKQKRSRLGKDTDEFGNIVNPKYDSYAKGYHEYLNSHPQELSDRQERLRKLGYFG